MSDLKSVSEVNSMKDDEFEWVFGNVIELCAAAATRVKDARPFRDLPDLCAAFYKYLDELSLDDQLEILKSHPDLAGRLAKQSELTRESNEEQQAAGLGTLALDHQAIIDDSNKKYKLKFGFPFIICARENKVQSIIQSIQTRYNNTREQEIATGIDEVKKICRLRILDIVKKD